MKTVEPITLRDVDVMRLDPDDIVMLRFDGFINHKIEQDIREDWDKLFPLDRRPPKLMILKGGPSITRITRPPPVREDADTNAELSDAPGDGTDADAGPHSGDDNKRIEMIKRLADKGFFIPVSDVRFLLERFAAVKNRMEMIDQAFIDAGILRHTMDKLRECADEGCGCVLATPYELVTALAEQRDDARADAARQEIRRRRGNAQPTAVKCCPICNKYAAAVATVCPNCKSEFTDNAE